MQTELIAFVHTEKTGGITLNRVLQNSFGLRHCDVQTIAVKQKELRNRDLRLARAVHPGLRSIAGHKIRPYEDLDGVVRYFTFLRDPVKRCISHYQFQVQHMNRSRSFEEWIRQEYYRDHQTKKIAGAADLETAIRLLDERFFFVGLTERFDESLQLLNRLLGNRLDLAYEKHNVATDNTLRDRIMQDPEQVRLAREANALDQRLYDYAVNTLYPRYQARAQAMPAADEPHGRGHRVLLNRVYRGLVYKPALRLARLFAG